MSFLVEGAREGYLTYKLSTGPWKKFWFNLDGTKMVYYNGPEKGASVGSWEVKGATIRADSNISTYRSFCFEIATPEEERHLLSASSEEEKGVWVNLLKSASEGAVATNSPTVQRRSKKLEGDATTSTRKLTVGELPTDETNLELDEEGKIVKAGTFEKLIECLYDSQIDSAQFIPTFLLTYRAFSTPTTVIETLMEMYDSLGEDTDDPTQYKKAARLRIVNFMKKWISDNFHDFQNDKELVEKFYEFTQIVGESDTKLAASLKQKMSQQLSGETKSRFNMFNNPPPPTILPKKGSIMGSFKYNIEAFSPLELARQITLIEYELYRAIEPQELLDNAWNSPDKLKKSPNVCKLTENFNRMSRWVSLSVIKTDLKNRSKVFSQFIKIADELLKLGNYSGVFEVIGGLNAASVLRLKNTQEKLSGKKTQLFNNLKSLTSPQSSWKEYRSILHKINPPCIPFIGVYQTDLTFIEDGNPKFLQNGLINFKKCQLVATTIKEMHQYQQSPYNLTVVPSITDFITQDQKLADGHDSNTLYELSLKLEPRVATQE